MSRAASRARSPSVSCAPSTRSAAALEADAAALESPDDTAVAAELTPLDADTAAPEAPEDTAVAVELALLDAAAAMLEPDDALLRA